MGSQLSAPTSLHEHATKLLRQLPEAEFVALVDPHGRPLFALEATLYALSPLTNAIAKYSEQIERVDALGSLERLSVELPEGVAHQQRLLGGLSLLVLCGAEGSRARARAYLSLCARELNRLQRGASR